MAVSGRLGQPTTNMAWTDQDLIAEEIAAIAVIPENVLDDASYDLWGEVRSRIGEAIGKALDAAVFFGVGAPATFPGGGILAGAAANAHTETEGTGIDYGEDFNQAVALVEGDNFDPTITFAPLGLKPKLRGLRDKNGNPIYLPGLRGPDGVQADQLYGVPIRYVRNESWDSAKASCIVADPRYLILGIRQDIQVKMLDQASIGGVSLPETDSLAMRVKARFGFTVVLRPGQCPGDAADVGPGRRAVGGGEAVLGDDIGNADPAAGHQDPEHLGEHCGLVGGQVDHAVGDHHIDGRVGEREVLDLALAELDVGSPRLGGVGAGEGEHVIGHVHA